MWTLLNGLTEQEITGLTEAQAKQINFILKYGGFRTFLIEHEQTVIYYSPVK